MDSLNPPKWLYRCYCRNSQRQLCSGRSLRENMRTLSNDALLHDFRLHIDSHNVHPTALVSTTSSLLRAIHLAFQKLEQHRANVIQLVVVAPKNANVHHGLKLAQQLKERGNLWHQAPLRYSSEYLFEWLIPHDNVIHTISLQVLMERGFTMPKLIDRSHIPPTLGSFRRAIQAHWRDQSQDETAYACAIAATRFGFSTWSELLEDLAKEIYKWTNTDGSESHCPPVLARAIKFVRNDHASTIGETLREHKNELQDLQEVMDSAGMSYIDEVGDVISTIFDASERREALGKAECAHSARWQKLERQLDILNVRIGY